MGYFTAYWPELVPPQLPPLTGVGPRAVLPHVVRGDWVMAVMTTMEGAEHGRALRGGDMVRRRLPSQQGV